MLIVSAIVLTSSTYAWFATNSSASVGEMSASVANNDGSLQVKATTAAVPGSDWKTSLTSADYTGVPRSMNPVSMAMVTESDTASPQFYKVAYDGTKFTATGSGNGTPNGDYIKYGFDVQYINAGSATPTINLTPTWAIVSDFVYALVKVTNNGTTTYYMFRASGSYTPIVAMTGDVTDAKGTGSVDVIDSGDSGWANATKGTYADDSENWTSGTSIDIQAAANDTTTINVEVYIWAEGQDPQCSGTTASGSGTMSFSIGLTSATESSSD